MNVLRSKNLWKLTFGPGQLLVDGMIERFLRQPTQWRASLRSEADGIWTAVPHPALGAAWLRAGQSVWLL